MSNLLPLFAASWPSVALAQGGPEVHLQSISGLAVESVNGRSVEAVDAQLDVFSAGFSSSLPPIKLFEERWLMVGRVDFEYTRLSYVGGRLPTVEDHDLYRAGVGLLNLVQITEKLGLLVLVEPGFYSDFGGPISGDDVGVNAVAMGTWAFSEFHGLGLGAGYVWFFGRPRWTPVGQYRLELERVQVDLLIPRRASTWWNAAGPVWLGVEAEIDGGFYRIHPEAGQELDAVFQAYSRSRLGLGGRVLVRDRLAFELTGGVIPQTRATLYLDADTSLLDYELSPGWTVVGQISLLPR